MRNVKLSRRSRWVVPAGALAVTGAVIAAVPALTSTASAAPALPAKTPAQLLAQLAGENQAPPPLTGTITETVSLGLPKLPDTGNPSSITSLLTGSHTVNIWYASPKHFRLALPQSDSETDVYRDGTTAYLWQSSSNSVTKFTLPNKPDKPAKQTQPKTITPLTPQQAANQALALAGKSTKVTVASNETVAGQAAYTLVLVPKESGSLIGQVSIAIDASNNVPLQVQIYPRGASSPAISVGYTQVTFAQPSSGDLAFTPPASAKVSTETPAKGTTTGNPGVSTTGSGWLTVAEFPSSLLNEATSGKPSQNGAGVQGASSAEAQAALGALVNDATPTHGGSLLRTSLLDVFITGNKVYVGAVDPSVLYAAAGK